MPLMSLKCVDMITVMFNNPCMPYIPECIQRLSCSVLILSAQQEKRITSLEEARKRRWRLRELHSNDYVAN
ncbi:hypothetical protein AX774_g2458 [Zancudomyces culisetae]|uniref:Uncharacterized protein n=1 Tax=Zancudomyces culisetae TaxID=1213189 RepID=A0A1R1PSQ5_ZANCU|nr:hypothetical protein AX774_g2458 [Zancudomyces culisetae]|eukprot:OMH84025.1 hypothetical protein AX774_g2458 [Zancudomyces culisetae]